MSFRIGFQSKRLRRKQPVLSQFLQGNGCLTFVADLIVITTKQGSNCIE